MSKKTDSNSYTIIFSVGMVLIVGSLLAFLASYFKPTIDENKRIEKQQNILYAMGVNENEEGSVTFISKDVVGENFSKYITKQLVIQGGAISENDQAYLIDIKNPAIVLDDAEDLDLVAEHIVNASFWNMGENCSANSRLIVQENIKEALLEKILAHLRDWKTGDPLDPSNYLGSLVDDEHFKKVCSYLKQDNILVGGTTEKPNYVLPTIVDQVDPDSKIAQEEIFGPILSVITVKSFDEAIAVANNTEYGLAASVFTSNGKKAIRAARAIKAGTVTVNCYGEGDMSTPFGGYKHSGFGGRDNSIHAHDQYTELKTIWIDLSDRAPEESVD